MNQNRQAKLLRVAAVLTIISLGIMVWAVQDAGVLATTVFMSIGQLLAVGSLVLFLVAMAADVRQLLGVQDTPQQSVDRPRDDVLPP